MGPSARGGLVVEDEDEEVVGGEENAAFRLSHRF